MSRGEVLIAHHIEPMWRKCYDADYLDRVIAHLERATYKRVLWLTLEGDGPEEHSKGEDWTWGHFGGIAEVLGWHQHEVLDWSYGWEGTVAASAAHYNLPAEDFIEGPWGHGVAYLYDYLKRLRGERVAVIGGGRGECLADLLASLRHLGVRHRIIDRLVY